MRRRASVTFAPDEADRPVVRLALADPPYGDDDDVWCLSVEIDGDGMKCEGTAFTLRGDGLDEFLDDLVRDWRGWQGTRRWETMEHDLRIEATHRGRFVQLLFVLRRDHKNNAWEVRVPICVTPGEALRRLAAQIGRLLSVE